MMSAPEEREANQVAYRQLRKAINETYAGGRLVAISGGQIVGDAATFADLNELLRRQDIDSPDVLVVQAGVDYPESVTIFGPG